MIHRLDLIRHAHALPASPEGDAGRELSTEGIAAARTLARSLRVTGWSPDVVFTSPLTRARQTAAHLVAEQKITIAVEILDDLISEDDASSVWAAIAAAAQEREYVVVVGHQPMLGLLIDLLTGQSVAVAPCSLHAVEFNERSGSGGRIVARAQSAS